MQWTYLIWSARSWASPWWATAVLFVRTGAMTVQTQRELRGERAAKATVAGMSYRQVHAAIIDF